MPSLAQHLTPEEELRSLAESFRALAATGCGLSPTDIARHAETLDMAALALRQLTAAVDAIVTEYRAETDQADRIAQQDFAAGLLRAAPLPGRPTGVVLPFERRPRVTR